jgi:integrase/recombinase XerD
MEAPYRVERERYLSYLADRSYTWGTLRLIARELLWIARMVCIFPGRGVTLEQVEAATTDWTLRERECGQKLNMQAARVRFIRTAKRWFLFLGRWSNPANVTPFDHLIEMFCTWMEKERGLTVLTIHVRRRLVKDFLRWFTHQQRPFSEVCLEDIDAYLIFCAAKGNCRITVNNVARALRAFFVYSGARGWCALSIASGIQGPRVFGQEQLPSGPSWQDVKRLIESTQTDRDSDIRDKAIIMLFAIYGFRAMEVSVLRVDDIDWHLNLLSVPRSKRRDKQTYPLISSVGGAIIRYLREVRPQCSRREVFLTMLPPYRPISREGLHSVVSIRTKELGIQSSRYGPHSLRHACATHLLSEGLSLKEIGDHLGHRSSSATSIYAKVDLAGLREVASFDLGELL